MTDETINRALYSLAEYGSAILTDADEVGEVRRRYPFMTTAIFYRGTWALVSASWLRRGLAAAGGR